MSRLAPVQREVLPRDEAPDREIHARLEQVTVTFAGGKGSAPIHALGPIDLALRKGEFFAIVGPSGCGKSTLLDVLSGLSRATSGQVEFEGRAVDGVTPEGVGVVFQQDASFSWLTVEDNVAFGLRRAGLDATEIRRRVEWALGITGLRSFAKAYPAQLSGGMRQRVCIARSLVMRVRLLLLDEPFAALDQQTRLLMGDEVLRLWRETGATVLMITHNLDEAAMLADRVAIMSARPGRLLDTLETGWPRDRDSRVVEQPDFGRHTAWLWSRLREESLKAMRHDGERQS